MNEKQFNAAIAKRQARHPWLTIEQIESMKIQSYRLPTKAEISFGNGTIHRAEFPIDDFLRSDGTLKRFIVENGLRYYRIK